MVLKYILALAILLISFPAYGQEEKCPYALPQLYVVTLKKGDKAPNNGVWLSDSSALSWSKCLRYYHGVIPILKKKDSELCEEKVRYLKDSYENKVSKYQYVYESNVKAIEELKKENTRLRVTPWYRDPIIIGIAGFSLGVVLTVTTYQTLTSYSK